MRGSALSFKQFIFCRSLPMSETVMATFSHIPSSFRPAQALAPGIEPPGASLTFPIPVETNASAIVGDSAAMKRLRLQIRRIGPHFRSVLIHGERGTGKETVARALHRESAGAEGPFVAAASGNRISYLMKMARGGTLFFDSIDTMPVETQDELLEALRRCDWAQNGLAAPQNLSTRIVASTNQDLKGLVAPGRFRQELYHRIAMVQIAVLPLRERMEDVPALAMHLLDRSAQRYRGKKLAIAKDAMEILKSRSWPGNVQELEDLLEGAVLQSEDGVIRAWELSVSASPFEGSNDIAAGASKTGSIRLQEVVDRHVLRVLKECAGNKLRAAELLGISRSTLYRMLDSCAPGLASSESEHD